MLNNTDKELLSMIKAVHYFEDGGIRPTCINENCNNPVHLSKGNLKSSVGRVVRTVCGPCHRASYSKSPLPYNVKSIKKDYCENNDGHLGFPCTSTIHYGGILELDHIDGQHYNNVPSNIQTLCKICHAYKGYLNGDFRN
jgi:hypothetical protein